MRLMSLSYYASLNITEDGGLESKYGVSGSWMLRLADPRKAQPFVCMSVTSWETISMTSCVISNIVAGASSSRETPEPQDSLKQNFQNF